MSQQRASNSVVGRVSGNPSVKYYNNLVIRSLLPAYFTRASGALWRNSNNELVAAEPNEPVFDGRRVRGFDIGAYKYGGE